MDDTRLVECAKFFRHHVPDAAAVPAAFDDERQALETFKDALLFEAHHSMQDALGAAPEAPISNAIDLRSEQPGIARTVGGKVVTHRSDSVVRSVAYSVGRKRAAEDVDASVPPPQLTPAALSRSCKAAERAVARAHEGAERRAAESFMTPEERQTLKEERKAERERKRAERKGLDEAQDEPPPNEPPPNEPPPPKKADEAPEEEKVEAPKDPVEAVQRIAPMGEERSRPRKASDTDPEFFASPAPHDRYLKALEASALHPAIRGTVLRGVPADTPNVAITHGPPGCGKTHALLEALAALCEAHPDARCLVAGPTNVSAADLHARAFARGLVGCLALAKENMPPGVPRPRATDLRTSRIVFSTVAGRTGPRLDGERFHAVFLDEAGLCPEGVVWGLLRPDVRHLWMVGDLRQLGAITSAPGAELGHQRSLMERLVGLGVAAATLTTQRRMHPAICRYPSGAFYGGALVTAQAEAPPAPHVAPYELVDVRGEARRVGTSCENVAEAAAAVAAARELAPAFGRTVLLTPYAAQLRRLRAAQSGIEAYTVDSFQGKEADAVVLSLVRTPAAGAGFWADERRLNVALTRAKHVLRIVGHGGWEDGPLGAMWADARERRCA